MGLGGGEFVGRRACQAGRGLVDLEGQLRQAVLGHGDRGAVEGVGLDDVGAGGEVVAMNAGDHLGLGQAQQIVEALQILRVFGEALAAKIGLRELEALHHRAHRPVEDEDARAQELFQLCRPFGARGLVHGGR